MEVLAVLAAFFFFAFFFAAPAAAFVALYKVRSLSDEVEKLRAEVRRTRRPAERPTGAEEVHDTPVGGPSPTPPPPHTPTELERAESTTLHSRIRKRTRDILELADDADREGWRLDVIQERLDTGTPVGKFTLTILAALAELERDQIAARELDRHSGLRMVSGPDAIHPVAASLPSPSRGSCGRNRAHGRIHE